MQTQQMTFQLTGSALKAQGMTLASDHTEIVSPGWSERTLEALQIFCAERKRSGSPRFVFEDFRITRSHDEPITHKAWGHIPVKAAHLGIIRSTGEYRKAKSQKTHAHIVQVWESL